MKFGPPGAARRLARFLVSDNGDRVFRLPAESSGPGRRKRACRNSSAASRLAGIAGGTCICGRAAESRKGIGLRNVPLLCRS